MSKYESWFRPWLDHPGSWEVWQLEPDEKAILISCLGEAAKAAAETLRTRYGELAHISGAAGRVERLVEQGVSDEQLFHVALAISAFDHYEARVSSRRPEPGGTTNPTNRRRWSALRAYLMERVTGSVAANAAGSLQSRAIFASLADNWLPVEQISRRLKKQFDDSGLFTSVDVTLDLRPAVEGGREWLRMETTRTLAVIKDRLARRRPVPVEVLRDPTVSPNAAQVVVVYRLDELDDGWIGLACYDPVRATEPVGMRLSLAPDRFIIYDVPSNQPHAAPKGLRQLSVTPGMPPLFGLRRWLRWVLPWRLIWWLKRRLLIFSTRAKDLALQSPI